MSTTRFLPARPLAFALAASLATLLTACGGRREPGDLSLNAAQQPADSEHHTEDGAQAGGGTALPQAAQVTPQEVFPPHLGSSTGPVAQRSGDAPGDDAAAAGDLEQQIRARLARSIDLDLPEEVISQIDIRVEGQHVVLTGAARGQGVVQDIGRIVQSVRGVSTVDNRIQADAAAAE